jgi:branched-chain amino acid transport system ATP-binding protein
MNLEHPARPPPKAGRGEPLLVVRNLSVAYGGIRALRSVSLEVRRGELVALLGANGAGKTTTLKAIMRLLPLAPGADSELRFDGVDIGPLDTAQVVERGISLVPEGRAVFADLSVRENLELGAYNHRDRACITATLAEVLDLFPRLAERLRQPAGTLSGGEQQMLAIGRALMARPAMLLLDEPSLGIAPLLVQTIFTAIGRIAEAGTTILLVEQNTRMALEASARAYVLKSGEIALTGASSELGRDPEVRAAYLGD